jgi:hypothetical protein
MNLDDDLAAWAATVRLPAADADAIFQRIVASPVPVVTAVPQTDPAPALDPSWWRGFTVGFTSRMVASTAPVRLAA